MKALATDLCNNILVRGREENIPITPMKLQKLLYFVCRDYAHETGTTPIDEPFQVWKYGPVLLSVYGEFSMFGANPITEYSKDATGRSHKVSETENPILQKTLDVVWAKFKRLSGTELSALTHKSGSGWYRAYMAGRETLSLEDILDDFT